ncbi:MULTISPECIES: hypothetical protein [Pseudobutyrivibrio]|uniref:DUF2281 domain-containing protein n=1 Tax=Pseudobutyrivibrio xylanivorans TaxID=185007 RepID=A0A5P6VRN0_PSEXY|nr:MULTISPECIES: hypothetical protein [Pseudobutyrivibrio]QFJ53404.1 hypothetical protein FXF36_00210 [Pseudobutyrivibrio xylanivorans]QFJ53481.1 hypothetical protein FXF36_00620 [Pseudobutyrivibrio xylanivorans]
MVYDELIQAAKGLSEYHQLEVIDFINYLKTKEREDFKQSFYSLREDAASLPDMSLDDINAEIAVVRSERKGK